MRVIRKKTEIVLNFIKTNFLKSKIRISDTINPFNFFAGKYCPSEWPQMCRPDEGRELTEENTQLNEHLTELH